MSQTISPKRCNVPMSHAVVHKNKCDIVGVRFDLISYAAAIQIIEHWRKGNGRHYVSLVNPHTVIQCGRDEEMENAIKRADMILPDGIGIILAAKLLGYGHEGRVAGPTLMLKICDCGREHGYRHYFLGGGQGIAQRLAENLAENYPGLEIAGSSVYTVGSPDITDDTRVIDMINSSKPDIVWVGLGSSKQEKWMARNLGKVEAPLMIGVGAAFAFHSGTVRWAPAWIRNLGLEWTYRLMQAPRRMWRRNIDNTVFLAKVVKQSLGRARI